VPTVAEQGYPGFEMTQWYGLLAPASLPQAAADKLSAAAVKAMKEPALLERLGHDAAFAVGSTLAMALLTRAIGRVGHLIDPKRLRALQQALLCGAVALGSSWLLFP